MAKKATRPSPSSRSAARSAGRKDQRATLMGLGLNKIIASRRSRTPPRCAA